MPLTPEDVRNRRFKTSFRGYDEEEVDTFLDEVEVELTRLLADSDGLRARLEAAQAAPPPPQQTVTSEAEEMLRRTLLLAQRTADETVAEAQAEAERLTSEARALAAQTVQAAEQQAASSVADLERRRQALEQHIDGLRAFEREYRTRLKAYLESQLRDLDGRTGPDPAAGAPSAPTVPTVPAVPPITPPAMPVVPGTTGIPPVDLERRDDDAGEDDADDLANDGAGDEAEPFDVSDGDSGVPRLAP